MTSYTIDVPGAFETYFTGSGVYAGETYTDEPEIERGAKELREAWLNGRTIRRGKGHTLRVELPSVEATVVLAEYAMWCLGVNYGGDRDYAEIAAARKTLERIEAATDGRVVYDGWNVRFDGRVRN